MFIKIRINFINVNRIFFNGIMYLKIFPIFDLNSNYGHLGISESEMINFFLNPSIALIPLVFSPVQHLIIVVMTSFLS